MPLWLPGIRSIWACRSRAGAAPSSDGQTTKPRTRGSRSGTSRKRTAVVQPERPTFMINYRVDNLDEMLAQLRAGGIAVVSGPESHENGKFAWIMDPDGNKVELWEPLIWDDKNKSA